MCADGTDWWHWGGSRDVRLPCKGNLLTAQPLSEDGATAPHPVTIGGSWTSGRIGSVHTVRETVAALEVRSELVDATFVLRVQRSAIGLPR